MPNMTWLVNWKKLSQTRTHTVQTTLKKDQLKEPHGVFSTPVLRKTREVKVEKEEKVAKVVRETKETKEAKVAKEAKVTRADGATMAEQALMTVSQTTGELKRS